jgi:hypothetical protein
MTTIMDTARGAAAWCALAACIGCGDRPEAWDTPFRPGFSENPTPSEPKNGLQVAGLSGSMAVLDPAFNQVLMLTSPEVRQLDVARLGVGRDVVQFKTSRERDRLFVLSRGITPRYKSTDEPPQLRVFDGGTQPKQLAQYVLQDPYEKLEIDALGEWLIVHGSEGLVSNPNELMLIKPGEDEDVRPPKALDSQGGKPIGFKFTSSLSVPGAASRRLLVVQRERDLAIIDLEDLAAPEITVGLPKRVDGSYATPGDVVFHDGVEGEIGAMLAVQLVGDPNVFILTLGAATGSEHAFSLEANLVDVGGVPTKLDFVQTRKDGGLRLAALVPDRKAAKLIDPASSTVLDVPLPAAFSDIRRITDAVSEDSGEDIALLYGSDTNVIAFWQLGTTTGTPYRSIDAYEIGIKVGDVRDIPGEAFADRKILASSVSGASQQFYVLDLKERKSFPLDVLRNLTLNLSPDGQRLWAFSEGGEGFAQLTFEPLQPASLYAQQPISYVNDFETLRAGERSAVALHVTPTRGNYSLAATLFDGTRPSTAQTKFVSHLEWEGIK